MKYDYPIIAIGAGAGGLVIAIGGAKAGKKVLLIEKGNYGGDCTNFGCIPSKSIIASAKTAHTIKTAQVYGINIPQVSINGDGALQRARDIVSTFRSHEDPNALKAMDVETVTGTASFESPHTLKVTMEDGSSTFVSGKNIVIATGSRAIIPNIYGLDKVPYRTNETIFDLEKIPKRLTVIGGGPIGTELAQAFHRLGAVVSIIQSHSHLLPKEELETQEKIEAILKKEGIQLCLKNDTNAVRHDGQTFHVTVKDRSNGKESVIESEELLIATGRRPNIEDLNLEELDIETTPKGIVVDRYGRTSYKHIWAVGDVAGHHIFTHVAEKEARTVLTNLLLPKPLAFKLDVNQPVPRVTYTDPEIASVGFNEEEAIAKYGEKKLAIYRLPFTEVDRAITTGQTEGFAKIITKKWRSQIIGATVVGPRAGEMLAQIITAMRYKIPLRKLATLIYPYPTYSRAIRKCGDQWLTKTIIPSALKLIGKSS